MFNTKYEAILFCLDKLCAEYFISAFFNKETALEETYRLAAYISQDVYVLREYPGLGKTRMDSFLKELLPERNPLKDKKIDKYILSLENLRYCNTCQTVKSLVDFSKNPTKSCGLNSQCKQCQLAQSKITQPARQARYRAAKLLAIVPWSDFEKITRIYSDCPKGSQVDHIIPLQGKNVCGLHVANNLQYLTKEENLRKYNKFCG